MNPDRRHTLRALRTLVGAMGAAAPGEAALGIVLLVAATCTEGVGLLILAPLLELAGIVEENPLPRMEGWLAGVLAGVGLPLSLPSVLVVFCGVALVRAWLYRWQSRLNAALRERLVERWRNRLYDAMSRAGWRFMVTRPSAAFVNVLTGEIGRLGGAVTQATTIAAEGMVVLVYVALAMRLSAPAAALVIACAGLLGWTLRRGFDRARATGVEATRGRATLHEAVAEHVAALKAARAFDALDRHALVFRGLSHDAAAVNVKTAAQEADLQQNLELGSAILLAVILYLASTVLGVPPSPLVILLLLFARLMPRLVTLYRRWQVLAGSLPAIDAIVALERECVEAAEPPSPQYPIEPLSEGVRFEGVSFGYLTRDGVTAVNDIDMEIPAGSVTVVAGPSGSGKSTVADLLLGLLTPGEGRILVDGTPLGPWNATAWRRQIGYVPQETFLVADTIRANVAWGRPGATDAEISEALRLASAEAFVAALPAGLDTRVGDRGVLLSGGERQRIAIARALLRRPRVLVLDEATSALDGENERRVLSTLAHLRGRMTLVFVSHDAAAVPAPDRVYRMDGGRIVAVEGRVVR